MAAIALFFVVACLVVRDGDAFSASTRNSLSTVPPASSQSVDYDAAVIGGGPAGLLTAIMLAQRNPKDRIAVYDRLPAPFNPTDENVWKETDRFYLIGLGHRGQNALKRFGVWDQVEQVSSPVLGRKDWAPGAQPDQGVERLTTDRPAITQVLPRDKLVGVLYEFIQKNYPQQVELNYEYQAIPIEFGNDRTGTSAKLGVAKCTATETIQQLPQVLDAECDAENFREVKAKFLVGADGAARGMANEMEARDKVEFAKKSPLGKGVGKLFSNGQFRVKRFVDDNKRVYKTVPVSFPKDWRFDLNYSARSRGSRITFEALPADDKGRYCALLLMREDDDFAQANCDPKALRKFFDEEFEQFSALIDDDMMAQVAAKPSSNLPGFRFSGPRINQGDSSCLLGDAIHTVKPYYGLGANTALEDVSVLSDCLDSTSTLKEAVSKFSKRRAVEAKALVTISRNMDRPGKLGTIAFVAPLILDGIFHKLLPFLFAPNMFQMFQIEGLSFRKMQIRKRSDRLAQIAILSTVFYGIGRGIKTLTSLVARRTGISEIGVGAIGLGLATLLRLLKQSEPSKVESS